MRAGMRLVAFAAVSGLSLLAVTPALATHNRPQVAGPLKVSLVPAYTTCVGGTQTHNPPANVSSCTPPTLISPNLWGGTPDTPTNLAASNENAFVKFFSNGNITFRMRDVRCQANLGAGLCPPFNETAPGSGIITPPDYTGEIQETHTIKMTDHANTPGGTGVATASVIPFSFTVTCVASASVTIGSTCNLNTSYNAVVPGLHRCEQAQCLGIRPGAGQRRRPGRRRLHVKQQRLPGAGGFYP